MKKAHAAAREVAHVLAASGYVERRDLYRAGAASRVMLAIHLLIGTPSILLVWGRS